MISFYHVENEEGKLAADPELKEALRLTGFRWKSMKNDPFKYRLRMSTGSAISCPRFWSKKVVLNWMTISTRKI